MKKKLHPYIVIILSFLSIIIAGTIALILPFATNSHESIGFTKSLFMSTSAVCVTGLSVVNVGADFTLYGQIVMIILMEIGGLSFITIAVFFFTMIGAKIGVSSRFLLRESLNQNTASGLIGLVRKIVLISLFIQAAFAAINMIELVKIYPTTEEALRVAIFHSAASFNNAGFDVFGSESMIPYKDNLILNSTTMGMIILGSMGFVVMDDIFRKKFKWRNFSLHTKLSLVTTLVLIFGGALLIKLTLRDPEFSWLQSLFGSITCRTAGFTTYDLSNLKNYPAAYMIFIILMMIGASPCSTGGGVKTTTFAVVIIAMFYFSMGKSIRAFKRKISHEQIFKAFVLLVFAIFIVIVGSFLVCINQPNMAYADGTKIGMNEIFFEVVSAFSTTGLSMGITNTLNPLNRILLCFIMFSGRLGPLTIIGVLNKNWMGYSNEDIQFIEESVIIG